MIDWKKERTDKNYCGYCIGSPPSANCDGSCFTYEEYGIEVLLKNKIEHIKSQLKEIPVLKKELRQREKDFKDELKQLNNERNPNN